MAYKKKTNKTGGLLLILSILLLVAFLLKFDAVANVIDPNKKLGLQNIANDAFPIILGGVLLMVGIATVASVWVSIAFIAVGVGLVVSRVYQIYQRNKSTAINTPG